MADIRIVWSPELASGDWALAGAVLDTERELVTAVATALFTDRTAEPDDVLPDGGTDRRGWWGDHEADEIHGGWPIGSRLWLLARAKQTNETRNRAEDYIREALDPFVALGLVDTYDLAVEWFAFERLGAEIVLHRAGSRSVAVRFDELWLQHARLDA